MESDKRKVRTSLTIISIGLVLIMTFSLYMTFNINNNYKNEVSKYEEKTNEYNKLVSEKDNLIQTHSQLSDEITLITNIDENISKRKEEVFSLASKLEQKIQNKESNYKIAYLTFDDGPYYLTYKYLETLKEKNVKGTFFTIGSGKTKCYDKSSYDCTKLYKAIVDAGHTIANHTYSHAIFTGLYNSADSFINQINKQEDYIYEKTGVITNIARFPGGTATAGRLKDKIKEKLREENYGWVDWTAADGDGGALYSKSEAWERFTKEIDEDIEVVLFHDYSSITLSILPDAIDYLQERNYILLPLFYESVAIEK